MFSPYILGLLQCFMQFKEMEATQAKEKRVPSSWEAEKGATFASLDENVCVLWAKEVPRATLPRFLLVRCVVPLPPITRTT